MRLARPACLAALAALAVSPALADKLQRPTAVFAGLDKITGRIMPFDVQIDETVQFGALQVTPRVCYTRPPTETPQTDAFVEVDDVGAGKASDYKRIFNGWMFAASPGLHAVEHPVYDVWLTDCKGDGRLIKEAPKVAEKTPGFDDIRQGSIGGFGVNDAPDLPAARAERPANRRTERAAETPAALPPPVQVEPRRPARSFFPTNARQAPDIVRNN